MSKLFIDNEILPKAFRKLEPSLKLTWYYIWTHCDKSGVWELDSDLFEFDNGFEFEKEKFEKAFAELIKIAGEKILLIDFIKVNYGTLTENYNPHKPVFRDMNKNQISLNPSLNQAYFKLVDEDEEEDKDEEEDEEVNKPAGISKIPQAKKLPKPPKVEIEVLLLPDEFKPLWDEWLDYRKAKKKKPYAGVKWEQIALNKFIELSGNDPNKGALILKQTIEGNWEGLFELKTQIENGTKKGIGNKGIQYSDDFKQRIAGGFRS